MTDFSTDFAAARANMVAGQLRTNRVTDARVIDAMQRLPREIFVPENKRDVAYVDADIPLGGGRSMMAPVPQARMLQAAGLQADDNLLLVGAGAGYLAAAAGLLVNMVFALEQDATLVARLGRRLSELAIDNVLPVEGPHGEGYEQEAPYDVILVNGGVAEVPATLTAQLAEGGRLLAVIHEASPYGVRGAGGGGAIGRMTCFRRRDGVISRRVLCDAMVRPLPGFRLEQVFAL